MRKIGYSGKRQSECTDLGFKIALAAFEGKEIMSAAPSSYSVALDGGTTNTRARLVREGRIIATSRRAVGVRDAVFSADSCSSPLAVAVREALHEVGQVAGRVRPDLIVAAGMLSSEFGLTHVPHVVAPAGLDDLAMGVSVRSLPEVSDLPIAFVPGVRTPPGAGPDGWMEADVMRGEECETIGILNACGGVAPGVYLWPGSHTKLVEVDSEGRIVRSQTTLAGELTVALARHTLIAGSLPDSLPDDPDPEGLAAGARIVSREGLGRAAFLVRISEMLGIYAARDRGSFWIGAVIADDVAHLAGHPILRGGLPVRVGGRQPQRSIYAALLAERHPGPVQALGDEEVERASALGALAIARRSFEIERPGSIRSSGFNG
jgi:2-dehydro-3-deoxygalactonokinase